MSYLCGKNGQPFKSESKKNIKNQMRILNMLPKFKEFISD